MSNLVPITNVQAPQSALQAFDQKSDSFRGFTEGVLDSFPSVSIRGKVFRQRFQGEEKPILDANGYPRQYIDVVLVAGSLNLSKVYYIKGFAEGDQAPPDCFSMNGVKPDPSSPARQNPTCAGCPMNRFGSRITPAGKQAKACQDSRRIVIALHDTDLGKGLGIRDVAPIMLRVPQSSTKPLREYVEYLKRHRFLPNACTTRIGFDASEAFPKLTFQFVAPIDDKEYQHAAYLATEERTTRILEAPMAIDDADQSELGGTQAPPVVAPQAAPQQAPMPTWQPPPTPVQPQAAPQPVYQPQPAPQPAPAPVYTPPQPAPPPVEQAAPAPISDEMAAFRAWQASQAQAQPVPQPPAPPVYVPPQPAPPAPPPAQPAPPPPLVQQQAPAPVQAPPVWAPPPAPAAAPQPMQPAPGGWAAPAPDNVPGPGWAAPQAGTAVSDADVPGFLKPKPNGNGHGQTIEGTVVPTPPEAEAAPPPKKRKAAAEAPPAQGAQQAPAALDDILSKLAPKATQ